MAHTTRGDERRQKFWFIVEVLICKDILELSTLALNSSKTPGRKFEGLNHTSNTFKDELQTNKSRSLSQATLKELAVLSIYFLAPLNHLLSPACALQI